MFPDEDLTEEDFLESHQTVYDALKEKTSACFEPGGALTRATENFTCRQGQKQFAEVVAGAIQTHATEVIEAGTGTGKTFAYLTPAILAGCKVIVSTAGKPLQDQLYEKDLPAVQRALGINANVAVLKGRANYLCLHRLNTLLREGTVPSLQVAKDLKVIKIFSETTRTGDRSKIRGVSDDSAVWPLVTSSADNCLGAQKCEYAEECFVLKARRRARDSDICVVNHHLYLSAMSVLADSEQAEEAQMLPKADIVIFDEAHKLPDVAISFFGSEFSTYSVKECCREIKRITMSRYRTVAPVNMTWDQITDAPIHILMDFGVKLHEIGFFEDDSKNIRDIAGIESAAEFLEDAADAMNRLGAAIEALSEDDDDLALQRENLGEHSVAARDWAQALKEPAHQTKTEHGVPVVRWMSRSTNEARFYETPISCANSMRDMRELQSDAAWVFTSATLATEGNDFTHFLDELGLTGMAATHVWPSPFDYPNQAMLYVPQAMPEAKTTPKETYIDALIRETWPIIDMMQGHCFVLCTSFAGMMRAGDILRDTIESNKRDYRVLVQNEDSRTHLIDRFRREPRTILIGTMSFWEGIDIKGDALTLVIIDKLPFAPQGDPVGEAKANWIREKGGNPFQEHIIPLAAIALKQGCGRLIRSETDRGVVVIGDTRIIPSGWGYGKRLLNSLPQYTCTRRLDRVQDFWLHPFDWK